MGRTREAATRIAIGQCHVVIEASGTAASGRHDSGSTADRAHEASQPGRCDRDRRAGAVTHATHGAGERRRTSRCASRDGQVLRTTRQRAAQKNIAAVRIQTHSPARHRHGAGKGQAVEAAPVQTIELGRTREAACRIAVGQRHVVVEARRATTSRRHDSRGATDGAHEPSQARGRDRDRSTGGVADTAHRSGEGRGSGTSTSRDRQVLRTTGQRAAQQNVASIGVQAHSTAGHRHGTGEGQAVEAAPVQTIELGRTREAAGRVAVSQCHVVIETRRATTSGRCDSGSTANGAHEASQTSRRNRNRRTRAITHAAHRSGEGRRTGGCACRNRQVLRTTG